ncbi:unnamed protein product [Rangifer tarandus platyrhynchus]|uniref:Uncharacterized protein n=1 Tax=Rangifer tarandus platyrhynchus TaxID=3082113 RepID=A0AC59ZZW9_RANTA
MLEKLLEMQELDAEETVYACRNLPVRIRALRPPGDRRRRILHTPGTADEVIPSRTLKDCYAGTWQLQGTSGRVN